MTLNDLTEQLAPTFPPSVQKDLKTAVRVLAQALTYADPKSCPLEACMQPMTQLYRTVEDYLISQGKSPHTIRNTKNNLSRLFRSADTQGLFSLLPAELKRRFPIRQAPSRIKNHYGYNDGSYLLRAAWPPAVEVEFAAFSKWATDPFVKGRDAKWKKRPTTVKVYEGILCAYFGYLHHTLHIQPVQFSHLFDFNLVERFVSWHINEKWKRPTRLAHMFVQCVLAMASQYQRDPQLAESLKALRKRMPPVRPFYNKSDAWVPLREIERVGLALWPSKPPHTIRSDKRTGGQGRVYAARAGTSLMLRLWVHIPFRQRNMREMKLDANLYRTPQGQWRIHCADEELKIASKRGQPNVIDLPFPPMLINTLESYLATWRPILARIQNAPEVFLNRFGRPFTRSQLAQTLQGQIYSYTGRHWHPHMIRTIWATEWIQSSGDFMTAAIMLNDRLETVIKNYSHLRDENVAENAFQWVQHRINHH